MHIITCKRILDFSNRYPDCTTALDSWYRILKHTSVTNFAELKAIFPSADRVKGLTVFNIGGNKARLIASIHYNVNAPYHLLASQVHKIVILFHAITGSELVVCNKFDF